jgi:Zn-dependent protease with chaperone function
MNPGRINPNRFPSGTNAHFVLICISSFMVSFWAGRYLPSPADLLPRIDWHALAYHNSITGSGFTGVVLCGGLASLLYLFHARGQRRAFGKTDELAVQDSLASIIRSLAAKMGVRIERLLVDRDITNADALAFGLRKGRTILSGKRLRLMSVVAPEECQARMAHEIAHFRNGDVAYAFLSRALVRANLILIFLVIVWLVLLQPLAMVMDNYLTWSYCPASDPLCTLLKDRHRFTDFLAIQGHRQWAAYGPMVLPGFIAATPTALFWVLLLFLEHRSLLRVREVLADAQAAKLIGADAMQQTLSRGLRTSSIRDYIWAPFSAHPHLAERVQLIARPSDVALPTGYRFLFLGMVYSVASQLLSSYSNSLVDIDARFGTMFMLAKPHDLNSWIAAVWDAVLFVILPFPILAALLRLNISSVASKAAPSIVLLRILKSVALVGFGVIIGDVAFPFIQFGLSLFMGGHPFATSIVARATSIGRILVVCRFALTLVAVALLYWIGLRLILRGSRPTVVPAIAWGVAMVSTYYAVWMVFGAGYAAVIDWFGAGPYYAFIALLIVAVYALVAVPIVRRMSGKYLPDGTEHLAPWVYEI